MRDYSFGNFLHELRERRGLSQYQLGKLVGVSDKAVSKWENGLAKPQSSILIKLSDILGITVDELLSCKYQSLENEKGVFAMKNKLWNNAYQAMYDRYGKSLPIEILNRYLSEYAEYKYADPIVYFDLLSKINIAAKKSNEHMHVFSSIGASFTAYILGASDICPLKPHYFCPHCQKIIFEASYKCGWDLPIKYCSCGDKFIRDGHNIPFEAGRSFFQSNDCHIIISKAFYKQAIEIIKTYFDENKTILFTHEISHAETLLIICDKAQGFSSGQEISFDDYRTNFLYADTITIRLNTSEEFENYSLLESATETDFDNIDFAQPYILKAFQSANTNDIPEFKSALAKKLLSETSPACFHDLIQIIGIIHRTEDDDQMLFKESCTLSNAIAYRDDVFNYIQSKMNSKGLSNTGYAYDIMTKTRKGKFLRGIPPETEEQLRQLGAESWFLNFLSKTAYLFPKSHGISAVKNALILMWYKINYPDIFAKIMSK